MQELLPGVDSLHRIQAAHADDPTLRDMIGYLDTAILNAQPLFDSAFAASNVAERAIAYALSHRTLSSIDQAREKLDTARKLTDTALNQQLGIRNRLKRVWDYLKKTYGISPPSPPAWQRDVPRQTYLPGDAPRQT